MSSTDAFGANCFNAGKCLCGVCPVYVPHDLRQIGRRGFQQQMKIVVHHAVRMNQRVMPLRCGFEIFEKFLAVALALEYHLSRIAP